MMLFAGACGSDGDGEVASDACPSPTAPEVAAADFAEGRGILDGDEGSTLIDLEIAETPEQRQLGLMHRTCLEDDKGMAFIFFEESTGGFYMKDTLIPLSIAFFDVEGKILKILDMEPCDTAICETYEPGVTYMGALEVNQGSFEEWGIEEGDELHVIQNDRDRLSEIRHSALRSSRLR
jgi:uncharacterized membrane protein (UPF0127 family)